MPSPTDSNRLVVMITSPLEAEHAERIAAIEPARVELIYRPELMPPPRYVADHNGPPDWRRGSAEQQAWFDLLARAEVLWDFATGDERGPFALSPGLRWVQTTSAGVGPYVKRLGVAESDLIVTTASGIHAGPLTEFVFAALLFHAKRLATLQAWQREQHWERYCAGELTGGTMAIVGPGRIGRRVAAVARAFGMTVWAMGRTGDEARAAERGVDRLFPRPHLREMLAGADCVVLCTPHTPETAGMIGSAEIAAMRPGVVLVNIARGSVIDEEAMIAALQTGRIGFAALDVFQTEPLPAASPLWTFPNVLINPHSASTAFSENERITDIFVRNLRCYIDGRFDEMSPLLDKQRGY